MDSFVTGSGDQQSPEFDHRTAGETGRLWKREPTWFPDLSAENPSPPQLPRYYIKNLAEIIQYIAVDALSFPGNEDNKFARKKTEAEEVSPDDLFMTFVLYNIERDARLKEVVESLPASASFKSPDLPNEVLSVLESVVLEEITSLYKTSEVNFFCVKADEIRDSSDDETLSVVVRFVKDGKLAEHLLALNVLSCSSKGCVSDLLLEVLTNSGFNPEQLIAQCYDGASVVSGKSGGVPKTIQAKLRKTVPYIHCRSHQLQLVIVNACSQIKAVKDFFVTCHLLYNFSRKYQVSRSHSGSRLKRLLDDKGTGTLAAARALSENFGEVLTVLSSFEDFCREARDFSGLLVTARGLLHTCGEAEFAFLALLMKDVLSVFEPGNAALQDKDMQFEKAAKVVNAGVSVLKERRSKADIIFEELLGRASEMCEQSDEAAFVAERGEWRERREMEIGFQDFIAEGCAGRSCGRSSHPDLKQVFIDVHDYAISEAETRFSGRNLEYLTALDSLIPGSPSFLEVKAVKPLLQLVDVDEHDFAVEANLAKRNLLAPTNPLLKEDSGIQNALAVLFNYKKGFPNVYRVLAAAVTLGSSGAVSSDASAANCESAFSCLTHILKSPRLSMSHLRRSSLVLLGYGTPLTKKINMDTFLDRFSAQTRRHLV